ncbi:fk506-binding protein 2 precursor [Venturia nashicola]|uniref:peptidylprolyl isomerase n=1 Tax=Venturia nashicola TaxID=86259 RepID=A0A4Z1PJV7_9PEZI|nr:fk506-binding protein 2 precursor [Venturia nashicola]TLD35445.1 fk506-binding protein 2 precursor [Venturia nashicola]
MLISRLGALPLSLLATAVTAQLGDTVKIEKTKEVPCTRKTHEGDSIHVNYRGTLESNGEEFDTSYKRGVPLKFTLGAHQVIKGWDQGLLDMCIGEARTLTIPSNLAYGHRGTGAIPPDATLIFETELMAIDGFDKELAADPQPEENANPTEASHKNKGSDEHKHKPSDKGPKHDGDRKSGECQLLGPFALLIQGALGILALSSLVFKRYRETPRRPLKVWAFDASKQLVGSMLLHLANLLMSMLSSGQLDIDQKAKQAAAFTQGDEGRQPNPCSFYLLNLAIDTTIGIPILVGLLRVLHVLFLHTPLANPPQSLNSGNYGRPPRTSWWLKQSFIYFLGLLGMKLCVFLLFHLLPWLGWVGDWALRWTEGKEWVQITFVMLIFPLIMNGMQYYIIDSFIKDKNPEDYTEVDGGEGIEEDEYDGLIRNSGSDAGSEDLEARKVLNTKLKEANPTPIPNEYDPDKDGASSSPGRG